MSEQMGSTGLPSVKDLASSEASLRRACLHNIFTYLQDRDYSAPLTPTECLQLWRGFYVALYMHDTKNALSVQKLIAELAGTIRTMDQKDQQLVDAETAQSQSWLGTWTTAFWETVCREWASIDQWRMNKVLLLVRFFIREQFGLVLGWAVKEDPKLKGQVASPLRIIKAWPLSPRERKVPDGLRLHVLDVWVEELAGQLNAVQKVLDDEDAENSNSESKKSVLLSLAQEFMEPVRKISREALSKGVKIRAKEAVKLAEEQLSG